MKEILINILNFLGLAWWVEIVTQNPHCTYYFGPFLTAKDAEAQKGGYLEDLEIEGAQVAAVFIKCCKPVKLTIDEESGEKIDPQASPTFSS
ncbi:DUF1816 domain-containing protein [Argonema antarcticum]|uniref:DUF1816 domain-containing protein n=1 Tax=Argonema antarcticum TaxID=2942763 RepID=UPI0020122E17|nr:DUF1816 domain-containing protein [Argonema antarcticum]MCL1473976.1 DUF1816 domain-containing protein [Argonema antarcticum A004/B2]